MFPEFMKSAPTNIDPNTEIAGEVTQVAAERDKTTVESLETSAALRAENRALRVAEKSMRTEVKALKVERESRRLELESIRSEEKAIGPTQVQAILQTELQHLWDSWSWRLLRPLRNLVRVARGFDKETQPISHSDADTLATIIKIRQSLSWELTAPLRLIHWILPRRRHLLAANLAPDILGSEMDESGSTLDSQSAAATRSAQDHSDAKEKPKQVFVSRPSGLLKGDNVISPPHLGNDKTAYLIGLVCTGRSYVHGLILQNIGERAKYLRNNEIRFHQGPTSMIYSGHATIRHVSISQELPEVTSRILETVRSGFADLIFVYRHPLDSLLSNWIWWRAYVREQRLGASISADYKNVDDLCAELEQNFFEFKAFAEGDPDFFAAVPGPRFLSFPEFVEETVLYLQVATLSLRLEDFTIDPVKEFSKIVKVMSLDLDLSRLRLPLPDAKPYRYWAVKEKVPRFRNFIDGLDAETRRRIEEIGYKL
ncbi:MAG TPA: hypothetical protein VK302_13415 [Terriglobales bacterium]|nr:hypothetical protein [Terriglobales bacterium]